MYPALQCINTGKEDNLRSGNEGKGEGRGEEENGEEEGRRGRRRGGGGERGGRKRREEEEEGGGGEEEERREDWRGRGGGGGGRKEGKRKEEATALTLRSSICSDDTSVSLLTMPLSMSELRGSSRALHTWND